MLDGIMGTLDQQVDDKKSMMRANPGMQGTVGKDLIGVMALQKLQKEKQAAENELMLAQQNNPATIKEQLEREVAGLTQNEMAMQTAGILNQRQMQQQQRPQQQQQQQRPQQQQQRPQGIQQAARPPMGGAPRPMPQGAGIAGAPRPPMMASGGIVGFQQGGATGMRANIMGQRELAGGDVLDSRIAEINARIKKLREDATAGRVRPEALQRELARLEQQKQEAVKGAQAGAGREQGTLARRQSGLAAAGFGDLAADVGGKLAESKRKTFTTSGTQIEQPPVAKTDELSDEEFSKQIDLDYARQYVSDQYTKMDASDANAVTNTKAAPEAGPLAAMLKEKMNTGPTEEQKANIGQKQASSRLDSGVKTTLDSMAKGDPAAAFKTAQTEGDTRYNKDYDVAGIKAKRQAQDDEMARQLTPEAQRQQRLRAVGTQLGGIAGARAAAGNRTDARRMKMYKDSADNYAADMKANVEKLKAVDENAAKIMQQIATDRNTAVQVFGNLSIADQQAVTADKDRFQAQNEAAMNALLGGMKIESEAALMRSIQDSKDSAELRSTWEAIRTNREDQLTAYRESSDYRMLDEAERPAAMEKRRISLIKNFESLETEIIRQLQALNPTLDYSAFLKDSGGGDDPEINTSGLQDGDI